MSQIGTYPRQSATAQAQLKQDVVTKWNSTLYTLESILEQKMALAAYAADNIQHLTANQLGMARRMVLVLERPPSGVLSQILWLSCCRSGGLHHASTSVLLSKSFGDGKSERGCIYLCGWVFCKHMCTVLLGS